MHDPRAIRQTLGHEQVNKLDHVLRQEVNQTLAVAVEAFELRFHVDFDTVTVVPGEFLRSAFVELPDSSSSKLTVVSENSPSILSKFAILKGIANQDSPRTSGAQFHMVLLDVYRNLPNNPSMLAADIDTLCIAPEREGALLATELGWLAEGRSLRPHAKRIPFEDGLAIGLTEIPVELPPFQRCLIVDGAIASGATIMAIIDQLQRVVSEFHIFSVHATTEGVNAIFRLAERCGVVVAITVGHMTSGLNDHYYAIDSDGLPVIGDLGDTICDTIAIG